MFCGMKATDESIAGTFHTYHLIVAAVVLCTMGRGSCCYNFRTRQ